MPTIKMPHKVDTIEDPTPSATKEALQHMTGIELIQWADKHEMRFLCAGHYTKVFGRSWDRAYLFMWHDSKYYYELVGIKGLRLD